MRSRGYLTFCLVPAALAFGASVLGPTVLLRLHEQEVAQPVLGVVNSLTQLVTVPGIFATIGAGLPWRHPTTAALLVSGAVNAVVWFLVFRVIGGLWLSPKVAVAGPGEPDQGDDGEPKASSGPTPPTAPNRISRRALLRGGTLAVAAGGAGLVGWSVGVEPRRLRVSHLRFPVRDLAPELRGLRLVQVTDIHLGPWLSVAYVRRVVTEANRLSADIFLMTGDFVHRSGAYFAPVARELRALHPRIASLGVLGNHDWWEGVEGARRHLPEAGIRLLDNARVFLARDRRVVTEPQEAPGGLCLAGIGDLWEGDPDPEAALRGIPAAMPRILMSHNPDAAEDSALADPRLRVDLMVSGHTHGGQVRLPGLGAPVIPSSYGQKYAHGLVQGPRCPVYISAGIGTAVLPVRLGVPPEIAVIELVEAAV